MWFFRELFDSFVKNFTMTSSNGVVASLSSVKLFSKIVEVRPSEDQAIDLYIVSGFPNRKYTDALLQHIEPVDIKNMSTISGARFCSFLRYSYMVKKLVDEIQVLMIGCKEVKISPLVAKAKKVIISNVSPVLSNSTIKRYLTTDLGIRAVSSNRRQFSVANLHPSRRRAKITYKSSI